MPLTFRRHIIRRHIVRRVVLPVLVCLLPLSAFAYTAPNSTSDAKLAEAEMVAERVVQRFHETLDFDDVYKGFFVREPGLRRRAILFNDYDRLDEKDKSAVSEAVMEQRFISVQTAFHLVLLFKFLYPESNEPAGTEEGSSYLNCPKRSAFGGKDPLEKLMRVCIAGTNRKSRLFRPFLTKSVFEGKAYRDLLKGFDDEQAQKEREDKVRPVPRVEQGSEQFKIDRETPVYVVRREGREYYFVEEGHAMRLFYINFLPNFMLRLF